MLSQFDIGHIKGAFDYAEECGLSEQAKQKIAYCRKLIAAAEDRALMKFTGCSAPEAAREYVSRVSTECEQLGTKD